MTFEAQWRMTLEDFQALTTAYKRRKRSETFIRYADPLFVGLSILGALWCIWIGDLAAAGVFATLLVLIVFIRFVLDPWVVRRRFRLQNLGQSDLQLKSETEGLRVSSDEADTVLKWDGIRRVDRLDERTIVWSRGISGFVVPDRAFSSAEQAEQFYAFVKEKVDG